MTGRLNPDALVIGGGPAGLMAAGELARAGLAVMLAEGKPTLGRKLLMAGKSGLNLTMDEPRAVLLARYRHADAVLPAIAAFDGAAVQDWARGLGQEVFTGSSGRVFPVAMKSSPLLRAWLAELRALDVGLRPRWRWTGWDDDAFAFDTPDGPARLRPRVCVLALGGASWKRLGSDGAWAPWLAARGVPLTPFAASNAGLNVAWSDRMTRLFGAPVKGTAIHAGPDVHRGEFVISSRGLEGGGIYALSASVRGGVPLTLDLAPGWPLEKLVARLAAASRKDSVGNRLRKAARLDPARLALLMEWGQPVPSDPGALAALIKALPLRHTGLRPLDEAISTVGGVRGDGADAGLMLRALPGVFVAGEMLNWDAPTGGYLLTACLATGRWAGRHAAEFVHGGGR